MRFLEFFVIAAIVSLLAILGFAFYAAYSDARAPKFELNKRDWKCTKSEEKTHLQPMLVGKVTILMPMTHTACLEYRHVE